MASKQLRTPTSSSSDQKDDKEDLVQKLPTSSAPPEETAHAAKTELAEDGSDICSSSDVMEAGEVKPHKVSWQDMESVKTETFTPEVLEQSSETFSGESDDDELQSVETNDIDKPEKKKPFRVRCYRMCSGFCEEFLKCFDYKVVESTPETKLKSDRSRTSTTESTLARKTTPAAYVASNQDLFALLTLKYYESTYIKAGDIAAMETLQYAEKINQGVLSARKAFHFVGIFRVLKVANVYSAFVRHGNTPLWIKVAEKGDALAIKRIINEARCVACFKNKPYIAQSAGNFQTFSGYYLVLNATGQCSLWQLLNNNLPFPVDATRFYAAEVSCAVGFLHMQSLIHRSLNLENIMIDKDGHVVLTDFTYVVFGAFTNFKFLEEKSQHNFLAPEIVKVSTYSKSVDWWALGVIVYFMLHGVFPFAGSTSVDTMTKIIQETPAFNTSEHVRDAVSFCKALLNKDPSKRLGFGSLGVYAIRSHPFFKSLCWSAIEDKQLKPYSFCDEGICDTFSESDASLCDAASLVSFAEWQEVAKIVSGSDSVFKSPSRSASGLLKENYSSENKPIHLTGSRLLSTRNPSRQFMADNFLKELKSAKGTEEKENINPRRLKRSSLSSEKREQSPYKKELPSVLVSSKKPILSKENVDNVEASTEIEKPSNSRERWIDLFNKMDNKVFPVTTNPELTDDE